MKTSPRILIVEDSPDDGELLLRLLRKAKLDRQVKIIADGGLALEYLMDPHSKCEGLVAVFLDLHLPTLSGLELLKAIRSHDRLGDISVIILTSSNSPADIEKCRQLGVSSYVEKPITFSTFSKAVADSFRSLPGDVAVIHSSAEAFD